MWLLATIEGIGSARAVARLAEQSLGYRWLAGGVPVNDHGLADFRAGHADVLDDLLTRSLATFIAEGLTSAEAIIVDGTRIKASAGHVLVLGSYKRARRLDEAEAAARARIAGLKAELEADPAAATRRQQAARERAARERLEKIERARATLAEIDKERSKRAEHDRRAVERMKEPRASLSDPEARRMRFADGAVRPGYNVQVATTCAAGFITAIRVTDRRRDSGLASTMVAEAERRTGTAVVRALADTGYADEDDIRALGEREGRPVEVFIPPPAERMDVKPATLRRRARKRAGECETLKAWRARMASAAGAAAMRMRKRIERVNAHMKTHGLAALPVRGLVKAQAVVLLHGLAHNLLTALRLRAAQAA